tara:strand:+ start:192 stop:386 length:195 start_codon:yes stop_codon:yes gene_type:complete
MKKKIVYEGYCESTEISSLKKDWNQYGDDLDIAKVPYLHRRKNKKKFWGDGMPEKKVRITIEEI